jgi:hypothetical protein
MSKKNSNDTIGNRSRDLPVCSAVRFKHEVSYRIVRKVYVEFIFKKDQNLILKSSPVTVRSGCKRFCRNSHKVLKQIFTKLTLPANQFFTKNIAERKYIEEFRDMLYFSIKYLRW